MSTNFNGKLFLKAEQDLADIFAGIDDVSFINTKRVLDAFSYHRVSETHFAATTGYGYDDIGRDTLDKVWATVFGTETALVRPQFVNGTHAISCALYGALKPGKTLVSAAGAPYDTLQTVIGLNGTGNDSLIENGIQYRQAELTENGGIDYDALARILRENTPGAVFVQRSRGYSNRRSLRIGNMTKLFAFIKTINPEWITVTDNCYGEFTETEEPGHAGSDLTAGSLIKNPGGGLAPCGGYICGKQELVDRAAVRLTAPGTGGHCGCWPDGYRLFYQGLCTAPHTVAQALKTVTAAGYVLNTLGYDVSPRHVEPRGDIILRVVLNDREKLLAFCKGIQAGSPVDSFVCPEPWRMPGYDCDVVMAAGTFVQGSTLELSADAPVQPPYAVYLQGGLSYEMGKACLMKAMEALC
jgi:cystathionine beta-lyase family protein involved in aluminum resistance